MKRLSIIFCVVLNFSCNNSDVQLSSCQNEEIYSFEQLQDNYIDQLVEQYGTDGVNHIMKIIQTGVDRNKTFTLNIPLCKNF